MTIFHSNAQFLAVLLLVMLVGLRVRAFIRTYRSGVLDYGYNRVVRAEDPKRFRFWFTADIIVFGFILLGVGNWITRL